MTDPYMNALQEIAKSWPVNSAAPKDEDYDDMESAYGNGLDVGTYTAAKIAQEALAARRFDGDSIKAAIVYLKLARALMRKAGAARAGDYVARALKSAHGAANHAERMRLAVAKGETPRRVKRRNLKGRRQSVEQWPAECWSGCDDPQCPYIHDK